MRVVKLLRLIFLMLLVANSMSCGTRCKQLIKYQTNEINVKALKSKIGGKVDLALGEIKLEHKFRPANDTLKLLDGLQYDICNQIRGLKKGERKEKAKEKYIYYLELMMLSVMGIEVKAVEDEKKEKEESDLEFEKAMSLKDVSLNTATKTYIDFESNLIIAWQDGYDSRAELRITFPDGKKITVVLPKDGDHWEYSYKDKVYLIIVEDVDVSSIDLLIKMK